jgi:hypothetical protein
MTRRLGVSIGALLVVAVLVVLLAGQCTGVGNLSFPEPPSTVATPDAPTTVIPDLTGVSITPVAAAAPTSVPLSGGKASLSGVVIGPTGAIPSATVLVERLVGDSVGATSIPTGADGTWKVTGIRGGRYRIRAWRAPDLALTTPTILFLGGTDNQTLSLNVSQFSANGTAATATVVPNPPTVGVVATLTVQITSQVVGNDGVVRSSPIPGDQVELTDAGNVVIAGANPGTTDGSGRVTWQIGCVSTGPEGMQAVVNGINSYPLTTPDCSNAVIVPPTTAPGSSSTTSTTFRRTTTSHT